MIIVIDFGSQTSHLIARRIKELGVETKIIHPETLRRFPSTSLRASAPPFRILQDRQGKLLRQAQGKIFQNEVKGLILSGGPSSVYIKKAPTVDPRIFKLGMPILGICYGLQIMAKLMEGKVVAGRKEYGPASLTLKSEIPNPKSETNSNVQNKKFQIPSSFEIRNSKFEITKDLAKSFVVWMSHGDEVAELPKGFETIGSTEHVKHAFIGNKSKNIYGVQFHPEVEHTQYGLQILKNFINLCHLDPAQRGRDPLTPSMSNGIPPQLSWVRNDNNSVIFEIVQKIKQTVGDKFVIGAVSGGVDSTVAAVLTAKAIDKKFIPIYVDNGLMREGTKEYVKRLFANLGVEPLIVDVEKEMLKRLKGITDPEKKRKIIGNFYIEVFEKEMKRLIKKGKDVEFLLQGTIYSDVIESKGSKNASKIKSHHNVGGLPKNMKLKLLEPLRNFYKDEVRSIGALLDLPNEFIYKQPFPGPGFAVRIRGEVTKKRLEKAKKADSILLQELEKAKILSNVFQSFPVLTDSFSTAVKGDGRFFGEVVAIRIVETSDIMTANWSKIPYEILQKISSRIVNEVHGISRVVYDITTKPPATMEWE